MGLTPGPFPGPAGGQAVWDSKGGRTGVGGRTPV